MEKRKATKSAEELLKSKNEVHVTEGIVSKDGNYGDYH